MSRTLNSAELQSEAFPSYAWGTTMENTRGAAPINPPLVEALQESRSRRAQMLVQRTQDHQKFLSRHTISPARSFIHRCTF